MWALNVFVIFFPYRPLWVWSSNDLRQATRIDYIGVFPFFVFGSDCSYKPEDVTHIQSASQSQTTCYKVSSRYLIHIWRTSIWELIESNSQTAWLVAKLKFLLKMISLEIIAELRYYVIVLFAGGSLWFYCLPNEQCLFLSHDLGDNFGPKWQQHI